MVQILYSTKEDGFKLLNQSNLPWLATGAFGLDILLGKRPGPQYHVYVKESDMNKWNSYLQNNGAQPTSRYGDIALSPVENLDSLRNGQQKPVVEFSRLVYDAAFSCPRYIENVRSEIHAKLPEFEEQLEKLLKKLSAR